MRQEPDVGLDPGSPGLRPGPKVGAKLLCRPGIPHPFFFFKILFIGVQFAAMYHNTQCSSHQVPSSVPITQSPQPPTHFPFHYPLFISQS